jgi:hypothetical protein
MTNLARIVRSQQESLREENQKKGKNSASQCLAPPPLFCPTCFARPEKGRGAKMVMRLTNTRHPLLIKGDVH